MFKSTNNYKDYFFNTNDGQTLPLMSLILIPSITLFLAYSTLVSSSEKNKDNVTKDLNSIKNDDPDNQQENNTPETPTETITGGKKYRKTKKGMKKKNRKTKRR
tara:strand:- start:4167 stop:4478 length:312 start_codon:yes stop_codon:yes gene_type:complete